MRVRDPTVVLLLVQLFKVLVLAQQFKVLVLVLILELVLLHTGVCPWRLRGVRRLRSCHLD